jgi:hypothetical protein
LPGCILRDFENRLLVTSEVRVVDQVLDRACPLTCCEGAVEIRCQGAFRNDPLGSK